MRSYKLRRQVAAHGFWKKSVGSLFESLRRSKKTIYARRLPRQRVTSSSTSHCHRSRSRASIIMLIVELTARCRECARSARFRTGDKVLRISLLFSFHASKSRFGRVTEQNVLCRCRLVWCPHTDARLLPIAWHRHDVCVILVISFFRQMSFLFNVCR